MADFIDPFEYLAKYGKWPEPDTKSNVEKAKEQAATRSTRSPRSPTSAKTPRGRGGKARISSPRSAELAQAATIPLPASPRSSSPRSSSPSRRSMVRPGRVASPSGRELKPPRGNEGAWKDEKPGFSLQERMSMNPNCFLGKRKDGSPGYPICSRGTERISCGGVVAAKRRAGQYKNYEVLAKAEELNQRYKCTKKTRLEQERAARSPGRRGGR